MLFASRVRLLRASPLGFNGFPELQCCHCPVSSVVGTCLVSKIDMTPIFFFSCFLALPSAELIRRWGFVFGRSCVRLFMRSSGVATLPVNK